MNYATSLAKTAYKGTKSVAKSVVSYVTPSSKSISNQETHDKHDERTEEYSWLSCVIFFRTPYGRYIVDQACLILGDAPPGYHAFFTNFTNWTVANNKLFYNKDIPDPSTGECHNMMEIDPANIYLHIRVGNSSMEKSEIIDNISNYEYYAPTPTNKMYRMIADQLVYPKVKIFDISRDYNSLSPLSLKDRISQIVDPRFLTYKQQTYGKDMENLMYNGINIPVL